MALISIGKACKILGVTPKTLRVWENDKKINVVYTPNGHRRYDYDYIITLTKNERKKT
jgi:DNA-binding transcriptional MerR regulator